MEGLQKIKSEILHFSQASDAAAAATGPSTTLLVARAADTSTAVLVCTPAFYFFGLLPCVPTSHLSTLYYLPFGLQST